ncbi:histidine kinase [Pseudoclavibacter endophyticus]|uniref:histidine kinase n=1 Tax=Pseudoclavibacter endophyticus TaxID=1778590 RepID=A0A6H9WQ97_9MICO|nr:sensor histidine kinase [Pseudoclavibacter endophyticus]KAB1649157.1 PAS domain-containing protein [Pseudoclavibacter endophyticus]GGA64972.1 histidine kinase [Pseudoclavibacter endophyticus]
MSSLTKLLQRFANLPAEDRATIVELGREFSLLADLVQADVVMWVRTTDDGFVAIAQTRPSSAVTLFYRDLIGQRVRDQWAPYVHRAFDEGITVRSTEPDWFDEIPTQLTATPAFRSGRHEGAKPIAVITSHTNLSDMRAVSRQERTFRECGQDLFAMIERGDFPDPHAPAFPRRGAPRASDGLIKINTDGIVTFASANALSAMNKLGFGGELEGEELAEVTSELVESRGRVTVDEALPLVVTGRAPWMTDVEARDVNVTMRSIPVKRDGERIGAIIILRDTTELRHQQQELITKDATIREIHHRVKNNLQTVAALLRIQARRSRTEEARDSLTQAMRRVSSIAVVHDTLAGGFSEEVDFDQVFTRVMKLITEVSSQENPVWPRLEGSFGSLPSEYATPLALALTELVTNAVEHGLANREGEVVVTASRDSTGLLVTVSDTGEGVKPERIGSGLGTQIVRTLVEGELGGSISWGVGAEGGTLVRVHIPGRWTLPASAAAASPGVSRRVGTSAG